MTQCGVATSARGSTFSDFTTKLIAYSRKHHENRPDAPLTDCIAMGAGLLVAEYGDDKEHLVQIALSEVAAQWVFNRE